MRFVARVVSGIMRNFLLSLLCVSACISCSTDDAAPRRDATIVDVIDASDVDDAVADATIDAEIDASIDAIRQEK